MHTSTSTCSVLTATACVAFFVGCGKNDPGIGPLGIVKGHVTFESVAVTEGTVQFSNATKGYAGTGEIDKEGRYLVRSENGGLPIGDYQVSVMPPIIAVSGGPNTPSSEGPKEIPTIPRKYRSTETSGLTMTIREGENTYDIQMKKE